MEPAPRRSLGGVFYTELATKRGNGSGRLSGAGPGPPAAASAPRGPGGAGPRLAPPETEARARAARPGAVRLTQRPGAAAAAMEASGRAAFVLSNLAEVVERVLGFLPTKALLRAAW